MDLPFFTASDVKAAVSMPNAINAMKEAFCSNGTAVVPHRINILLEEFGAHHLSMPAYIKGGKILNHKINQCASKKSFE